MRGLRLAAACFASTAAGLFAGGITGARAGNDVMHTHYDGNTNDLLTAGLGKTGLGSAVPPGFVDALNPTAEELRRLAIYNNYRALIDPTPGGGYGTLYGSECAADGHRTAGEGKIAGDEYIAYEKGGGGKRKVTMMVQIPTRSSPSNACIITRRRPVRAASTARSRPPAMGPQARLRGRLHRQGHRHLARTTCRPTP
jgi:hydroxybutyrate-dimer hydrolase